MAKDPKMLDIIRRIGDATPPPIRLSKLFQSPEQDCFSFSVTAEDRPSSVRVFELLAQAAVNIRFIGQHMGRRGGLYTQFCADAALRSEALQVFQAGEIAGAIRQLHHRRGVRILSLYPFNGQPQIAERVFTTFANENIEILGVNTAASVFSCIVSAQEVEAAIAGLKRVFVLQ